MAITTWISVAERIPSAEEARRSDFLVLVKTPYGLEPRIGGLICLENLGDAPDQSWDPTLYPRWYVEDASIGEAGLEVAYWLPIPPLPIEK